MKALDDDTILNMYRRHIAACTNNGENPNKVAFYALKRGESMILTNNRILIEWPLELVDSASKELRSALRNGSSEYVRKEYLTTPFSKVIIKDRTRLMDAEELEPRELDKVLCTTYELKDGSKAYFDIEYHSIFDMVFPPINCQPQMTSEIYAGKSGPTLIVRANGKRVGALAGLGG